MSPRTVLDLVTALAALDAGPPIVGVALDPVTSEIDHFFLCGHCGQFVDMRDLRAVLHHDSAGHDRLPEAA